MIDETLRRVIEVKNCGESHSGRVRPWSNIHYSFGCPDRPYIFVLRNYTQQEVRISAIYLQRTLSLTTNMCDPGDATDSHRMGSASESSPSGLVGGYAPRVDRRQPGLHDCEQPGTIRVQCGRHTACLWTVLF